MMFGRIDFRPVRSGAGFDEDPPDTWWAKWFSGVAVPLAFLSYAVYGGISGGGAGGMWLPWLRRHRIEIAWLWAQGWGAICLVGMSLGVAMLMHVHFFWGQRYAPDHPAIWLGTVTGLLLALIGGGGFIVWLILFS